jgi:competence protein ComGC
MKNKISENSGLVNMAINLAILGLLIYLAVAVKDLQKRVIWTKGEMRPLMGMVDSNIDLEYNIKTFMNNLLKEAIAEQEK